MKRRSLQTLAAGLVSFVTLAQMDLRAQEPQRFLSTYAGFSAEDLASVEAGSVVAKTLDTGVKNEVAVLGAARVRATTSFFVRMYRDIERFETGWGVTKKLSDPPKLSDFEALMLPEEDLKALASCKVGDCDLKLGEAGLDELRSRVDWTAPDAAGQALTALRELALRYSQGYLEGGNEELAVYRDKKHPTEVAEELAGLIENSPYILDYRPELQAYLLSYPKATLPGASGFLYWSLVDLGPKPTFRLSHVTLYPTEPNELSGLSGPSGPSGKAENGTVLIASKQLYFSHYFYTGLELHSLVRDRERPDDGFYLVTVNRYRTDLPTGLFGKMAAKTAADAARGSLERYLTSTQAAINQYFRDEPARPRP